MREALSRRASEARLDPEGLARRGRSSPGALRKDLRRLRSRCEFEVHRDARKVAAREVLP